MRLAAAARRSPAEVRPSTVAGVPVLLFRQYSERAMLLVQPYGRDLYVGWTMWRSRSTATLLLHFLRDTFGRFAPSPRFSAELRAAATRALRESVHSLSREGVAAALQASGPRAGDAETAPARVRARAEPAAARPTTPARRSTPQPDPHRPEPPHGSAGPRARTRTRWACSRPPRPPGPTSTRRTAWTGEARRRASAWASPARPTCQDWGPPPRDRW